MASGFGAGVSTVARMISSTIPNDIPTFERLNEDMVLIGLDGSITKPWGLKSEEMIRELVEGVPNQFALIVCDNPDIWTEDVWAEVYGFRKKGAGFASRADKFSVGKFGSPPHPKEGYAIGDCNNERHKRVLEFLIPILYPEKPTRVTVMMANTIFGTLEWRNVHWGRIIESIVRKLVENVPKSKVSPISPYLFHLYYFKEVLTTPEVTQYEIAKEVLTYLSFS